MKIKDFLERVKGCENCKIQFQFLSKTFKSFDVCDDEELAIIPFKTRKKSFVKDLINELEISGQSEFTIDILVNNEFKVFYDFEIYFWHGIIILSDRKGV